MLWIHLVPNKEPVFKSAWRISSGVRPSRLTSGFLTVTRRAPRAIGISWHLGEPLWNKAGGDWNYYASISNFSLFHGAALTVCSNLEAALESMVVIPGDIENWNLRVRSIPLIGICWFWLNILKLQPQEWCYSGQAAFSSPTDMQWN